jgi:hypothetical integral membrane protein (TIGR02206 family)
VTRPVFTPFTAEHFVPVAVIALLTTALVLWTRRQPVEQRQRVGRAFGAALLVYYLVESVVRVAVLDMRVWDTLPFELCSALFFIGAFAYWYGHELSFEVVYFWTFAGTLHALLTPTPRFGFPDLNYFQYFAAHGLLIGSAVFSAAALSKTPGKGAMLRAFLALQAFTLLVAGVDALTGENYLYLRHKPPSPNALDAFGPWPNYLLGGEALGLVSFFLWNLPFLIQRRRTEAKLPPGPRAPGIWQLLRFATKPFDFFDDCAKRFGDLFTVDMAMYGKFVMVSSPELIKAVFTGDTDVLHAGKANRDLKDFLGDRSLLLLDGPDHLRHRKMLMPPFHGERMKAYAGEMWAQANAVVEQMPGGGAAFSIHPYMQRVTMQIIMRSVFGLTSGGQLDRVFQALLDYLEEPPAVTMYLVPFDWPLTPYRKFLRRRDVVRRELEQVVREGRAQTNLEGRTDVLSLMLAARDEAGQPLTDLELRDELMTLLIAGHETTATSLSWAFERVLNHPEVEAKLRAELDGASTPEAIVALPYLDAVVKETLRTRPILPDVVRDLQAPFELGGQVLPKGLRVAPCIHLAHFREASWPEARAFKPERFVDARIDPHAWLPFGGGIRRCIGFAFALYEMKLVLGAVLKATRLELEEKRPLKPVRRGITLAPEGGTRVRKVSPA